VIAPVTVRPTTEDDWERIRDLRLEMLRDTPLAYVETLEAAQAHGPEEWRTRGRRGTAEGWLLLAAITPDDRWVGMMGCYVPDAASGPLLIGVYVAPDHRGRTAGVTDALLSAVEAWAHEHGGTLRLHVHEANARARAAYASRGFVETGVTEPYSLDPSQRELEMLKHLQPVSRAAARSGSMPP